MRLILLAVLLLAIVLGGIWFYGYWTTGRFVESTNDATIQADAVIVSPKVGGYVEEVFVSDNQTVKQGDPLFRIDARDYTARVAQAQAQIDAAQATATGVRAQIAEQQAAVAAARAQLASSESDLKFARATAERYRALAATGAESRETLAEKQSQFERAQAAVTARRADLASAQRRVTTLQAQVGQALAQAEGGEAQRAAADVDLNSAIITAAIGGRIGNKTVQQGQFIQPGTRTMSIVPVEQLYIQANFKETQLGLLRPGQPVTIEIDALPGVELQGKVESLAPGTGAQFSLLPPENATGNFTKIVQRVPVRISLIANAQTRALLVPGMSVTASVDTRAARGALDELRQQQQAQPQVQAAN
ncbi:HlyD family efflux transporter periplasmic adaptor subunit [Altererythrobacter xixiisoli]|uniref:HlyD family efflux transporter periplasmic adaptor subunit n=2 Tax=Croceibacterium xixiisoli TaxID=1476466 RepID=A0A6I4TQW0_9SPHN|nr:HlyD family efflux transporter periplasmic adaptor subunit [Croceibacterium xixiisoli]